MIIAISSQSDKVYPHFGRAPAFTFITIENGKITQKRVLSSPGHTVGSIPNFIKENGANLVLAGGMGINAIELFNSFGIDVMIGISGKINTVVKKYLKGTLKPGETFCAPGSGRESGSGISKAPH